MNSRYAARFGAARGGAAARRRAGKNMQDDSRTDVVAFGEAVLTYKPAGAGDGSQLARPMLQAVGGAELNVAVALARAGGRADWVSVLPLGPLGEIVLSAALEAGVNTSAVDLVGGCDIGTLHVVEGETGPTPHYQRRRSAFAERVNERTFAWPELLRGARWLALTGITPLLGDGPYDAWSSSLSTAKALAVDVVLDLNWRPALGTFDILWPMVERALPCITLLILSEADLHRLSTDAGIWPAATPHLSAVSAAALLSTLRARWGVPLLACTFKRSLAGAGAEGCAANVIKKGGNARWSTLVSATAVASTADIPVRHRPVQARAEIAPSSRRDRAESLPPSGRRSAAATRGSPVCSSA